MRSSPGRRPGAAPARAPPGETTYSLYRNQRLAAETDSRGRITAHYVYLYGKPVAKIMEEIRHEIEEHFTEEDLTDFADAIERAMAQYLGGVRLWELDQGTGKKKWNIIS